MLPEAVEQNSTAAVIYKEFPKAIQEAKITTGELQLTIDREYLIRICQYLKESAGFERLSAVTGVDWWPQSPRFEVIYFLHSIRQNARVRLIVRLAENEEIDSVFPIWRSANWYEREVFDLFGVVFRNHPSLDRIMMPVDWVGHPLRKDYPIHGHKYSYKDE